MDIPVSRLNQRMALQLPAELPLGLVFVVGQVELPAAAQGASNGGRAGEFYLADNGYRLPCRLSERAATEFRLEHGDMVRAGGHLVFEPVLASYYLLARDIERLDGFRPASKPLAAIIADNSRREQAASLTPAELPPWVEQMAPSEVRPQQASKRMVAALGATPPQLSADWELLADTEAAVAYPEAEPALAGLSDELIAFLSQAMDSQVEVEITPEIMDDLNTTGTTQRLSAEVLEALDLFEASVSREAQDQVKARLDSGLVGERSRPEPVRTWPEQDARADDLSDQQPAGAISVAEFTQALESAVPAEAAGVAEAAVPAGESAQDPPPAWATAARDKRQAAQAGKTADEIPWYVALLIIAMVVIILAAFITVILLVGDLPLDLSLDLPQQLPLLN